MQRVAVALLTWITEKFCSFDVQDVSESWLQKWKVNQVNEILNSLIKSFFRALRYSYVSNLESGKTCCKNKEGRLAYALKVYAEPLILLEVFCSLSHNLSIISHTYSLKHFVYQCTTNQLLSIPAVRRD